MRNLSDFHYIYNIQDVIIIAVILEYRWQKIKDDTGFDPRCFTSASTLSSAIERIKSKCILTYPQNVEIVDLMEQLLSEGYSSVHMHLGFDTEMFTPKSKEYMKEKDQIIEQMRNPCGEPDEKSKKKDLNTKLYDLFKQEDLKSCNKPIYNLRLDGETESHSCRVFSKIFKIYENNEYGFAMTKPLHIGSFKREMELSIGILNKSKENFDPDSKISETFVVDIEFDAYDDPRKRMYNEVFQCIFEPKTKVPVESRSVYQLISTMKIGRKGGVLKFKAMGKTHATLCSKKRFPMFINHIHFLTKEQGGKLPRCISIIRLSRSPLKKNIS